MPPVNVKLSLSRSMSILPESVVMSKSCAVTCESTYAFILSEEATFEELAEEKLSSS